MRISTVNGWRACESCDFVPKKWSQRERIETQIMEKKPVCEVQILAGFQHSAKRAPKNGGEKSPLLFCDRNLTAK